MGCFDEEGKRMSQKGVAVAPSNIALVKYWGKRDIRRNLPAMGSLSVSLKGLETRTTVEFLDEAGEDEVWVDGSPVGESGLKRVKGMLSIVREATGVLGRAEIRSQTSFPVGAGIASSASGMAAVVLAAASAARASARGKTRARSRRGRPSTRRVYRSDGDANQGCREGGGVFIFSAQPGFHTTRSRGPPSGAHGSATRWLSRVFYPVSRLITATWCGWLTC